ncbi:T-cell surface glycoprotein CD3 epsilon chain [Orycteropus afer afer]|uniref:T-cell surface glycoprotein CD3 epsilon chain n=1 Tax=Orycteropus afer afer TaxID=1230840 RepID=A0A8B6ZI54_ORYAF|nr:T-cell surface glycoprotein CD3 epsilon chain [Orycteropus afer afer]
MLPGTLWVVLGLCLLSGGAWGQSENEDPSDFPSPLLSCSPVYKVSISGTTVELTCPDESGSKAIKWEHNGVAVSTINIPEDSKDKLVLENFSEMEHSGYYTCYTDDSKKNHPLYLKARVCENCMEVNLMAVIAVVVADICVTLGLLLMVYYWSKNRKAKTKPVTRGAGAGGRPRGQNKERPPPVPNPDYEPIRKGQRDLYAGLNQRNI